MRIVEDDAIVLAVGDFAEQDRLVALLTREHGRIRGVARSAKRRYSRFAGELTPLGQVRATWVEKAGRDLVRISSVEGAGAGSGTPRALAGDLEGLLLASCIAEHFDLFAPENEPNEALFRLLASVLAALANGAERGLTLGYVETWVLRLAGLFPAPVECPHCGRSLGSAARLLASGEAICCVDCAGAGGTAISPAALDFLRRTAKRSLAELAGSERFPPELAHEVGEITGAVRRHFLGHELKSYGVRRRMLAGLAEA